MRPAEIVAIGQERGLFTDKMYSETPQKSMHARLSMDIVRHRDRSRFVRTGRGFFFLSDLVSSDEARPEDSLPLGAGMIVKPFETLPRQPKVSDEMVLIVPSKNCRDHFTFQGLAPISYEDLIGWLSRSFQHMARTNAERDSNFKQAITYTIITRDSRVLSFRRGRFNRAANFLRGSACIGFGGHVTDEDYTLFTASDCGIRQNAAREISEEIRVNGHPAAISPDDLKFVGVINDDSSDIGRNHFAVVFHLDVSGDDKADWEEPKRGEMSINELQWLDTQSGTIDLIKFEYWSQLCWRQLWPGAAEAQPRYRIFKKKNFWKNHILTIIGGIGSGKSFATRHLKENYGYQEINSGKALSEILGIAPVPHTPRLEFQQAAWQFISSPGGPERLAAKLLADVAKSGHDRVIIDGIRQMSTLRNLKETSTIPVTQIFVHATPDLAMQLYKNREGNEDIDPLVFMDMINAEVERDISALMHDADAVIYNWLGETDYSQTLDAMATELRIGKRVKHG